MLVHGNSAQPGRTLAVLLAAAGIAAAAHAQSAPDAKPAPTSAAQPSPDADALRGPKIAAKPQPTSLVRRDMSGNLDRLEIRPEQGALELLQLTPEERKPPDAAIDHHKMQVHTLLKEHYDLFLKIQAARQGGAKPEELRPLMREMRDAAMATLDAPLEDSVASALPEQKRTQYRAIVDEYKRALADADRAMDRGTGMGKGNGDGAGKGGKGDEGEKPKPVSSSPATPADDTMTAAPATPAAAAPTSSTGPIPPRVEMNLLLREMGRELKSIVDERKEHMDRFLKSIDATPEQEAQIREIVRATAEASRKKEGAFTEPSQEDRAATWRKIMDVLTPEQRTKAMEARRAGG